MSLDGRLEQISASHGLGPGTAGQLSRLLTALASEPDPPTTVRDPDAVVEVHVADSLVALDLPEFRRAVRTSEGSVSSPSEAGDIPAIADLGAGAGFPGLPLAIALPHARVDLIEATRRKCDVIARLAAAAGIDNARPVPARAEEWAAAEGRSAYSVVTARALAPLPVLAEYAAPLLQDDGLLVAWKGGRDAAEERAGAAAADILGLEPLAVVPVEPYASSRNRHLHLYRKSRLTPERFPRRPGMAAKRPLA